MIRHSNQRTGMWRGGITAGLLVALSVVLWLNVTKLHSGIHELRSASLPDIGVAISLLILSFCIAAGIYLLLAQKPLHYLQVVKVEVASAAINRILPAGLGGLGLHGAYLYKQKHTIAQATAVVSVNNLVGISAHLVLLVGVIVLKPDTLRVFKGGSNYDVVAWIALGGLVTIFLALSIPRTRRLVVSFAHNLFKSLEAYIRRPQTIIAVFVLAICLTLTYTAILYVCINALGIHLSAIECFIVFSVGMLIGTATPTPGGLVGTEAGLFAGFTAYGFTSGNAIAASLLFRVITYWLPIIPGGFALLAVRRAKIV